MTDRVAQHEGKQGRVLERCGVEQNNIAGK